MRVSFYARIALQIALIAFGIISIVYSYLGIVIGLIGTVLLVCDVQTHYAEKDDFKKNIIPEALGIVDHIIVSSADTSRILYPVWSLSLKPDILSDEDYRLWKQFYDSVEQRNEYLGPRMWLNWTEFTKYNRAIFENFFVVYDGISWVRTSIPEERIANLRAAPQHTATL